MAHICVMQACWWRVPKCRPRRLGILIGGDQKEVSIGEEAQANICVLRLNDPIVCEIAANWEDMESQWHRTFYNELKTAVDQHLVLATEALWILSKPWRNGLNNVWTLNVSPTTWQSVQFFHCFYREEIRVRGFTLAMENTHGPNLLISRDFARARE